MGIKGRPDRQGPSHRADQCQDRQNRPYGDLRGIGHQADALKAGTGAPLVVRTSRYLNGDLVFTKAMLCPGTREPDAVGTLTGWDIAEPSRFHPTRQKSACARRDARLPSPA